MAKELDWGLKVSEFKFQSCCYVHFRTNIFWKVTKPLTPPAMGLIVPQLYFYKDNFGIK